MFSIKKQSSHDINVVMNLNDYYPLSEGDQSFGRQFNVSGEQTIQGEQTVESEQMVESEQTIVRLQGYRNNLLRYRKQFVEKHGHPQYEMPQFRWPARNA